MSSTGLRERKKALTRQLIADTAARLFAARGYEKVAVGDVAREAQVAEQTVYNYFPTKEQLVTDREQEIQEKLSLLIRSRPRGSTPAAAIREFALQVVAGIRDIPSELWRGEIGYLAAISPTVHRLVLDVIDRQARALAAVISDTTAVSPEIARLHGIALAGVFEIIISEAGRRTRDGQSQTKIARELSRIIANVLDELDRPFRMLLEGCGEHRLVVDDTVDPAQHEILDDLLPVLAPIVAPKQHAGIGARVYHARLIGMTIPTRYGTFSGSKLEVTVAPGRTPHDIELND